jgi:ribosome biogenesis GTPase
MSKRRLNDRQIDRIQSIQERRRERATANKAVSDEDLQNMAQLGPEITGTVITNFGAQVDIEGIEEPYKGSIVRCHMRANLERLVTGDTVVWRYAQPHGVVVARQERKSELLRPDIYGKLRPVAANIDRIAIVFSPKPTPFSNLIDRYLVASEDQGITPFLILNKTDMLAEEDYPDVHQLVADYTFIGYDVLVASAQTGEGVLELQSYLANHTSIFVGQSGVGKSSLLNQLQPEANMLIGPLSLGKEKGTHTTTASRLFHLEGGGVLIDSPGIREFALTHLSADRVIDGFIDFHPYLGRCKFRDCKHNKETGCELLAAVADGHILPIRLHNYRQIILSQESDRT